VIARGNERKAVFRDDRDREEYLDRLDRYRQRFGFSLYAYCLMTNHVHLALEEGEGRLSRIMHALQSSYTLWFNRRWRRVGHLFQGRFKSFLVDRDEYLVALLRYIHDNPVRAGMVKSAEVYRWSSDRYLRKGRGPQWLSVDGVLTLLGPTRPMALARYRELMGGPRDTTYADLPAIAGSVKGGEAFAVRVLGPRSDLPGPRWGWDAERVARAVARTEGVSFDDLRSSDRRSRVAGPRIVAAFLGRSRLGIPVADFARLFHREQSTMVRGVLSLERRINGDPLLRQQIGEIEQECLGNT
jgi:REP element-mobilizing transposase RayT